MPHANLNHYRFYLGRHTTFVFGGVKNSITWIRHIENGLGEDINTLLGRLGPDELKALITTDTPGFRDKSPGYLENCCVGVTRYQNFLNWLTA